MSKHTMILPHNFRDFAKRKWGMELNETVLFYARLYHLAVRKAKEKNQCRGYVTLSSFDDDDARVIQKLFAQQGRRGPALTISFRIKDDALEFTSITYD